MAQCEAGTKAGNRNQGHEAGKAGEKLRDGESTRREIMEQGPLWEQVLCVTETLRAAVISSSFFFKNKLLQLSGLCIIQRELTSPGGVQVTFLRCILVTTRRWFCHSRSSIVLFFMMNVEPR